MFRLFLVLIALNCVFAEHVTTEPTTNEPVTTEQLTTKQMITEPIDCHISFRVDDQVQWYRFVPVISDECLLKLTGFNVEINVTEGDYQWTQVNSLITFPYAIRIWIESRTTFSISYRFLNVLITGEWHTATIIGLPTTTTTTTTTTTPTTTTTTTPTTTTTTTPWIPRFCSLQLIAVVNNNLLTVSWNIPDACGMPWVYVNVRLWVTIGSTNYSAFLIHWSNTFYPELRRFVVKPSDTIIVNGRLEGYYDNGLIGQNFVGPWVTPVTVVRSTTSTTSTTSTASTTSTPLTTSTTSTAFSIPLECNPIINTRLIQDSVLNSTMIVISWDFSSVLCGLQLFWMKMNLIVTVDGVDYVSTRWVWFNRYEITYPITATARVSYQLYDETYIGPWVTKIFNISPNTPFNDNSHHQRGSPDRLIIAGSCIGIMGLVLLIVLIAIHCRKTTHVVIDANPINTNPSYIGSIV